MKKILGLDLGTTSVGWALVNEAENTTEESQIIRTGVRVIPLTTDEETDFQKGKSITINADRTIKRGARRNLQRSKLRRTHLIRLLNKNKIILENTILPESKKKSTYSLLKIRAKAAKEQISLEDFGRVLLAINSKRGYKSNRKAAEDADGQAIDGMETAKLLYNKKMTPAQLVVSRFGEDKKHIPEFYRSDLQEEFDKIWEMQKQFYPDLLTEDLKENLFEKNRKAVWAICEGPFKLVGEKRSGNSAEQKVENYEWRVKGISQQLELEQLVVVFQEINGQVGGSSSYLGAISDRSKELYFTNQTVGQYLYSQIKSNPHTSLKNQVFYRNDYLDEFNKIWDVQSKDRKDILTDELKEEIRDRIIFYQRRLKSQKGLISICELEGKEIEIEIDGKKKTKRIGPRVIPKSSPLFQEFKIWQILNNLKFENKETRKTYAILELDDDVAIRTLMFDELNIKGKLSATDVLKVVLEDYKIWEAKNFTELEGNNTNALLYQAYKKIVELSGHKVDNKNLKKSIAEIFDVLGINTRILEFDTDLEGKAFEQQPAYQFWHLIYSYEGDNSESGNDKLYVLLKKKYGFNKEYAKILANISFKDDYGSLSAKAMKKILPYLKAGHEYSEAATLAGYNHSHSITKQEDENRILLEKLELLPKNSLRNPVVEKILNQMVNVINAIIVDYGKPDEIRIELARELKKGAKERAEMTTYIAKATREHENIREALKQMSPFNTGIRVTKNDIVKYKLWQELKSNGYKTIYTNTYIPKEKIFSKEFDVEHIIPKALLFDDSFSNKTLAVRDFNRVKSNKTGIDAILEKYGENSEGFNRYISTIEMLYSNKQISKAKYNKLLMKAEDIPDGFIDRDLRNSQYIAKKAQEILKKLVRTVVPTSGSITARLRKDWQLINVMQELNWDKYDKLGLTDYETNKNGQKIPVIQDWTKRNDHRHHAMDAITVAFTKHNYIQYFNYLNARKDEKHKKHSNIYAIEQKETFVNDKNKRIVKPPMPIEKLRTEVKVHLENTLISFKAKNKVVTRNYNVIKNKNGHYKKVELTPRGQLHKETVYGSSKEYKTKFEKVGAKFTEDLIGKVANKSYRNALMDRLKANEDDPKKAFTGKNALSKNPIYLDKHQSVLLPEKVKLVWFENRYTIRKEINSDLNLEKIIDVGVKKIIKKRLIEFDNDKKKAFTNIEENPIWLNEEKGIKLKRVAITGVNIVEALHTKKDHFGNEILDEKGEPIPVDFVSTGNNHHIAIYQDEKGNLQEDAVSFYDAVARVNAGTPVIWKQHPEYSDWKFLFTMKQNEYFVFPNLEAGFSPKDVDLMDENNYHLISPNLFRVQKLSTKDYFFRHHLETNVEDSPKLKGVVWKREGLRGITDIVKVRINHIGKIVNIGEF